VRDGVNRLLSIRAVLQQQQLFVVAEDADAILTTAERDAIRTRLLGVADTIRDAIKLEVGDW
jgi:hypothetical protein